MSVPRYYKLMHNALFDADTMYCKHYCHGAALYSEEHSQHLGILEVSFLHSSSGHSQKLLRRLKVFNTDSSISILLHTYSNIRYSFCVSSSCHTETTSHFSFALLQPIVLVVDPYWDKLHHGTAQWFDGLCFDVSPQPNLRFFIIHHFNIYSCS